MWRPLLGLPNALWLATTLGLATAPRLLACSSLPAALLLSSPSRRRCLLSPLAPLSCLRLLGLLATERPALLARWLLAAGLGLARLTAMLLARLARLGRLLARLTAMLLARLARLGRLLARLAAMLIAWLGRLGRLLARLLGATTAGWLLSGTRLLLPLRRLVATLLTVEPLLPSLAGRGRLSLLAWRCLRRLSGAGLATPLSGLSLLATWALLGRLLLAGLSLLAMLGGLPRLPRLPLLPTRLGRLSALLAELLMALRPQVAALLTARWRPLWRRAPALPGWLLASGVTRGLLAWRSPLGWRLLPSPALVATLLAVLSLSVLGVAVLPSHGTRPVGRTRSSD